MNAARWMAILDDRTTVFGFPELDPSTKRRTHQYCDRTRAGNQVGPPIRCSVHAPRLGDTILLVANRGRLLKHVLTIRLDNTSLFSILSRHIPTNGHFPR